MVFAEATVMKTTEAAASVASNVATAMVRTKLTTLRVESRQFSATAPAFKFNLPHLQLAPPLGVTPLRFDDTFDIRKLQPLGYRAALFA